MNVAKMCCKCLMCWQVVIMAVHCLCYSSKVEGILLARPQYTGGRQRYDDGTEAVGR